MILFTIPVLVLIAVFSLTSQDIFAENRHDCRFLKGSDPSLTPVERIYALKSCSLSGETLSPFEKFYTEELHNQCTRITSHDSAFNHIQRLNDLKECNKIQKIDSSLNTKKLSNFSKFIISFCDEKYQVYKLVGAKKMTNQAGIYADECILLYSAPMWNSNADDRYMQLQNFLFDEVKKSLEKTKESREKNVQDSRLTRPILTTLKDLFDQQKEKIEYLENQLNEKNIPTNYSQQEFFSKPLENCLEIYYDDTILLKEKINGLTECSEIEKTKPMIVSNNKILQYSKDAIQFCEDSYHLFLILGEQDYYYSIKSPLTRQCVLLYQDPVWDYNHHDRTQVLGLSLYYKILKDINETSVERENSSNAAILDSRWEPILTDVYQYQKQKIDYLESILKIDQN